MYGDLRTKMGGFDDRRASYCTNIVPIVFGRSEERQDAAFFFRFV